MMDVTELLQTAFSQAWPCDECSLGHICTLTTSTLMGVACSSEILVSSSKTTHCHNPEHHILITHHYKNLKTCTNVSVYTNFSFIAYFPYFEEIKGGL
jgi:hypothetical protein